MKVKVRLFGHLREYRPTNKKESEIELESGSNIIDLARKLGIPEEELSFSLILVNARQTDRRKELTAGDVVSFVTLTEGG